MTVDDARLVTGCCSVSQIVTELMRARERLAEQEAVNRALHAHMDVSERYIGLLARRCDQLMRMCDPDAILDLLDKSTIKLNDDD
jgi:hypothetical protein